MADPARPQTSAARQRRMRQRRRDGMRPLTIDVPIDRLAVALAADGYISDLETDESVIRDALERAVEMYVAAMLDRA